MPSPAEVRELIVEFEQLNRSGQYPEWLVALDRLVALGADPFLELLPEISDNREDRPVRWALCYVLGRTRDPRAFAPLCRLLYDRYPSVQTAAVHALSCFPGSTDVLIQALEIRRDPKTLREAATALARIGDPRALAPLTKACEEVTAGGWGGVYTPQVLAQAVAALRLKLGMEP